MLDSLEPGWLWMIGGVPRSPKSSLRDFPRLHRSRSDPDGLFTVCSAGLGRNSPCLLSMPCLRCWSAAVSMGTGPPTAPIRCERPGRSAGRKVVTVVADVDDHNGRVRVGDSEWGARGGPAAAGERVRITGVDGNCLNVDPLEHFLPRNGATS